MTAISAATPDEQNAVAGNVRALMGRHQVSQKQLATEIGMSRPTLSSRLAGETSFTVRELAKIARFFGKSLGDVVTPLFLTLATPIILDREGEQLELPFDAAPPALRVVDVAGRSCVDHRACGVERLNYTRGILSPLRPV